MYTSLQAYRCRLIGGDLCSVIHPSAVTIATACRCRGTRSGGLCCASHVVWGMIRRPRRQRSVESTSSVFNDFREG